MTDSTGFIPHVIDSVRFNALQSTAQNLSERLKIQITTDQVQKLWEGIRNSCLEMLPTQQEGIAIYDDICYNYAEKFAFIFI